MGEFPIVPAKATRHHSSGTSEISLCLPFSNCLFVLNSPCLFRQKDIIFAFFVSGVLTQCFKVGLKLCQLVSFKPVTCEHPLFYFSARRFDFVACVILIL